jgi:hypothetical protein
MDSLKNFISECADVKQDVVDEKEDIQASGSVGGFLLITGCHDFENATSKSPEGLDEPHVIKLPSKIRQSFSSSSSFHSFFLSIEGKLYAVGRNDHGQLGRKNLFQYTLTCFNFFFLLIIVCITKFFRDWRHSYLFLSS